MKLKYATFFLFISCFVFGQDIQNDLSASNLFNKSKIYFEKQQYDSAYIYSKNSFDKFNNLKNDSLTIASALLTARSRDAEQIQDTTDYISFVEKIALKNKDWKALIEIYHTKGNYLFNESDFTQALTVFLKVDSISKVKNFDNFFTIKSLLKRAEISKLTFTYDSTNLAYEISLEALSRAKKINSQDGIHYTYANLADIAQLKGDFVEAKKYIDLALDYFLKTKEANRVSRMYLLESAYYLGLDSLEKADESRFKSIQFLEDKKNDFAMAKAKYYYGNFLTYYREDYRKAALYLEASRELLEKVKKVEHSIYQRCLRDLAICNDEFGSHEKSKTYYKQAYELNIELTKKANRNTSRKLETKYQTDKKKQEIALLKSEKALTEQKQKSQRNFLIGGLGLTTIAGLFLFVLYRNRQKTNTKLKELDKAKSNFFTNISHEFRTPLTLISGPIQDALNDDSLTEKKRDDFIMAQRNADRLLSLVNQILDISKIESGNLKLHIQKGNVLQLIAALSNSFKYNAERKRIIFLKNIKTEASETWYDKDALEKIVVNLLSNAVKYTPEKGSIVCNSYIDNNNLFLEVKNSGEGLTTDQLSNIFQRFYQTNEQNQGSGIGLSLVKELVELHKGKITATSEPNQWTTFTVTIPVNKGSFRNEHFISTTSKGTKVNEPIIPSLDNEIAEEFNDNDQPILLIVEDNTDLQTLIKQIFEESYNVITAPNGKIGIDLALEHIPDLIISDIMMPIKDGIALTKELKNDERTIHIPIILLTAKAEAESQFKGIETGADDYITKPFDKKLLSLKVKKLIESRKKLQSRYSQELILTPKDIAVTNLDEKFLEKVQSVLENKLVEASFSIEDFSKAVGMSRMQLHRKIKALTGLSASEFIRSQRLKLAAQLLKKSDINISQVGYTIGFNDHSYFTKCFKEAYKCTPTEYAKRNS